MRGSIVKKGERYYVVFYQAGKQKWKAAGPNKKDAERMLTEVVGQIHRGEYRELKPITFEEFADKWVADYAEGAVRDSTLSSYKSNINRHLKPSFGGYELTAITPEDIQQYVSQKKRENLAPQTIKNMLVPLKEMFKHAVRWGYLRESPALYVETPRIPHYEMDFMTVEEIRIFLDHIPQKRYALFLTAIMTGMRRGELLAMKWSNIDWNRGQYFVREALYRKRFVEPKSATSRRAINLPPTLMDVLRSHRARQNKEKLRLGPAYEDLDLVFCHEDGTPLDPDTVSKREFHRYLRDAGIRRIRFHDLRHTFAALLIAQGETPKYIQNRMGHSSIQITLDRYGHLMPEAHREAAERLDASVFEAFIRNSLEIQ